MKSKPAIILFLLLAMLLSACATAAAPTASPGLISPSQPNTGSTADRQESDKGAAPGAAPDPQAADSITRLVIKNASLVVVVAEPAGSMTRIMQMANEMGGYVVSSKSFKTTAENGIEVPQATVAVRVPAEKLDEALSIIRALTQDPAQDVRSENVTGQDVTADYVDLQSRLTNLQATEIQLQRIQESALRTEDILNVFNRLTEIRAQIEQIKGRMKYFEESAALSSISVELLSRAGIAPISIGGWQPVGVMRDAFQSLINVGKFLATLAIWLVIVFVPIGLIFYFPVRGVLRAIRRRQAKARVAAQPYPPTGSGPPQYPDIK